MASIVETEFLVAGVGPAGGSLAAFLAQHGLKGIVVCKDSSTANTPRAHVVNPFALECLRDIGLEEDARDNAIKGVFKAFRWCQSLMGLEYGKVHAWGESVTNMNEVLASTPCEYVDLPQSYMEPVLVRYASQHGFEVRFSTELVQVERGENGYSLCTVQDHLLGQTFQVRAKYVFGGDGARSQVARSLGFKFLQKPHGGMSCNIIFNADLTHVINRDRLAGLHWIVKPDRKVFFGDVLALRMIRPWTQWMVVLFSPNDDSFKNITPETPEVMQLIRESIGDDLDPAIKIDIVRVDPWNIRESIAERYKDPEVNAFILGDAAHRHPPAYALGSNTCIQDGYNLAWKVAYVTKGLAGPGLLDSYNDERQPVGAVLVKESNEQMDAHAQVWQAAGMGCATPEEGAKQTAVLAEASAEGAARRAELYGALKHKLKEADSHGVAMNQWYVSKAVYLDDEPEPRTPLDGDFFVKGQVSTYPGSRLPHAWLDVPTRGYMKSTQDLAGKTAFCLFIGIGGNAWRKAAKNVAKATGIPINVYGIGFGLDYHDVYRDWYYKRGVEEDGCVLVRPDRFVTWRAPSMILDCEQKLLQVLNRVLSRDEL